MMLIKIETLQDQDKESVNNLQFATNTDVTETVTRQNKKQKHGQFGPTGYKQTLSTHGFFIAGRKHGVHLPHFEAKHPLHCLHLDRFLNPVRTVFLK